ncbi:Centromere-associated protein E [Hondaea fermentalgiana]|uniref:Centromere-associated protein E n=1 Tax=Hondaea fermentalgiana TaxID=2315210 RepID=A0A2R5G1A2_9STRA|nr:Centromere-associated protein E [Hondaea fermentalgiana]|eukprot:GBG24806.1 Centromere-associated protein E [Hondaea fermentalgiana]
MASLAEEDGIEESISVSLRVRPLNSKETKQNCQDVWKVVDGNSIYSVNEGQSSMHTFDNVFDSKTSTRQVYDKVANGLVSSVLQGMNGTVFAYGQTASGKTYTMQGEQSSPGILELAAAQVFEEIACKPHYQFLLHVSYIEIFNEQVKDLLTDSDANLRIREDRDRGFFVDNLEMKSIVSVEELLQAKEEGERRRHVGETNMNLKSSRSHTIFTLNVEMRDTRAMQDQDQAQDAENNDMSNVEGRRSTGGMVEKHANRRASSESDYRFGILVGRLNLVDLAGSENARATGAEGGRLKEGGNINRSLLTLSRVISMLANSRNKAGYINWRDSKLTQILQPSLAGNCRTAIVCCITPASKYLEETRSTLSFASRAKQIRTRAVVNEVLDGEGEMRKLKRTIQELRNALASQQAANAEQSSLQNKIRSLKRLLVLGGGVAAGTADSDDEEEAAALAAAAGGDVEAAVCENMINRKSRRKRKQRETWCPGDFGSKILAANKKEPSAISVDASKAATNSATDDLAVLKSPPGKQRRSSDSGALVCELPGETRDVGTGPLSPVVLDEHKETQTNMSGEAFEEATAALEAEMDALRAEKSARETECAELAASLEETKAQLEREAEQFKASKEQIRALLEERSMQSHDLGEEMEELKDLCKAKDAQIEKLEHAAKQMKEDEAALLESIAAEQASFQKRIDDAVKEAEAHGAATRAIELALEEEKAKVSSLQAKVDALEAHNESESSERESSTKQIEAKLEEARAQEEALRAKLEHMEDVLVQSELDKESSIAALTTTKTEAEETRAKLDAVKSALATCAGMKEDTTSDAVELVAAIRDALQSQVEAARVEAAGLREEHAELEAKFAASRAELETAQVEAQETKSKLEEVKAALEACTDQEDSDAEGDEIDVTELVTKVREIFNAQIENARQEVADLREGHAELEATLAASRATHEDLENELETRSAETRTLQSDLDAACQERAETLVEHAQEVIGLVVDGLLAQVELTASEDKVETDSKGEAQARTQLELVKQTQAALEVKLQESKDEFASLRERTDAELEEAYGEIEKHESAASRLRAEKNTLESQLQSVQGELAEARAASCELQAQMKSAADAAEAASASQASSEDVQRRFGQLQLKFNLTSQELDKASSKLEETETAMKELRNRAERDAEQATRELEGLQKELENAQKAEGQLRGELTEATSAVGRAAHERDNLVQELKERLAHEREAFEVKLRETEAAHAQAGAAGSGETEALHASIQALERKVTQLKEDLAQERESASHHRERSSELEESVEQLESKLAAASNSDLEEELKALQNDLAAAKTKEAEAVADADEARKRLEKQRENVKMIQDECEVQAQRAQDLETAAESAREAITKAETEAEELRCTNKELVDKITELRFEASQQEASAADSSAQVEKVESLEAEVASLKAELETKASANAEAEAKLRADLAEVSAKLAEQGAGNEDSLLERIADLETTIEEGAAAENELKTKIASLEESLTNVSSENANTETELKAKVAELESQLESAAESESTAAASQEEKSKLEAQVASLQGELETLSAEKEVVAATEEQLRTQIADLESRLESATTGNNAATEELEARIAELKAEAATLVNEKQRADALEEALLDKESKISTLKREAKEAGAAVPELRAQLEARDTEIESAKEDAEKIAASMRAMEEELAALRKELPEVTCAANERIESLQVAIKEREAHVAQLREEVSKASQNAEAASQIAVLEEQLTKSQARIQKLEKVKFTQELAEKYKKARDDQKKLKEVRVRLAEVESANTSLRESQEKLRERIRSEAHLREVSGVVRRSAKMFGIHEDIAPAEFVSMVSKRLLSTISERDQFEAEVRALERQDSASNDASEKLEVLQSKYVAAENARVTLEARLGELADASAKADATSSRREEALREANKALEARVAALEASQRAASDESDKGKEDLLAQIEEHKSNIRFLEKENLDLMVDLRKLRDRAASHALETAAAPSAKPTNTNTNTKRPAAVSGKIPLAGIEANTLTANESPAVNARKPRGKSITSEMGSKTPVSVARPSRSSTRNENAPLNDNAAECNQQ